MAPNPNMLLVEGKDEQYFIPEFMERNGVSWPRNEHPVEIKSAGSRAAILDRKNLGSWAKTSELKKLGIIVDADSDSGACWQSLRESLSSIYGGFREIPEVLPTEGLVVSGDEGITLGVWIMPDNTSKGMLETFLTYLLPASSTPLWEHALSSVSQAQSSGATFKTQHSYKAKIHTWLAWQDPPGEAFGTAVKGNIFDCTTDASEKFVNWFKLLYDL